MGGSRRLSWFDLRPSAAAPDHERAAFGQVPAVSAAMAVWCNDHRPTACSERLCCRPGCFIGSLCCTEGVHPLYKPGCLLTLTLRRLLHSATHQISFPGVDILSMTTSACRCVAGQPVYGLKTKPSLRILRCVCLHSHTCSDQISAILGKWVACADVLLRTGRTGSSSSRRRPQRMRQRSKGWRGRRGHSGSQERRTT